MSVEKRREVAPERIQEMSLAPIRLLLIEDNPGDARLIQEILRDAPGVTFDMV